MAYWLFSITKIDRQHPQLGHVVGLVDLTLVGGAVAEVGEGHAVIAQILVGEGQTGTKWHVRAHNPVAAIEVLVLREHVHRAALAGAE